MHEACTYTQLQFAVVSGCTYVSNGLVQECMYLHDIGEGAASFTKEDMQQGKHTDYENQLIQDYLQTSQQQSGTTSADSCPVGLSAAASDEASNAVGCGAGGGSGGGGKPHQRAVGGASVGNSNRRQRPGRRNNNASGNGRSGRGDRQQSGSVTQSSAASSGGGVGCNSSGSTRRQQSTDLLEQKSSESATGSNATSRTPSQTIGAATSLPETSTSRSHLRSATPPSSQCATEKFGGTSTLLQGLDVVGARNSQSYANTSFANMANNNSLECSQQNNPVQSVIVSPVTSPEEGALLQHHHAALAGLGVSWRAPSSKDCNDLEHISLSGGSGILGCGPPGSGEDDDLDFDPFRESQLGLAEQMETEARAAAATYGLQGIAAAAVAYQQLHGHQLSASVHASCNQVNVRSGGLNGLELSPPPGLSLPPGFETTPYTPITSSNNISDNNSPAQVLMHSRLLGLSQLPANHMFSSDQLPCNDTASNTVQCASVRQQQQHMSSINGDDFIVKDMLRNMCPDANIRFGSIGGDSVGGILQRGQHTSKEASVANNHLMWPDDPAIVRSGQVHQLSSNWLVSVFSCF